MNWIIAVILFALVGFVLDREIYFYEGVHLGPRVQAWLYDRWARKYDEGKRASQLRDDEMLARRLLDVLGDIPEPFILDFAAGTGRLSYTLMDRLEFKGRIVALDLSRGMLEQAAAKLASLEPRGRVEFVRHQSLLLPFPDAAFDVVCALEVLELFPGMEEPVSELTRVLRPGGVFLSSRGTEQSGRRAKIKSVDQFSSLLTDHGLNEVQVTTWWKLFDRVLARKAGSSKPVTARRLSEVLRCKKCNNINWKNETELLRCQNCGHEVTITKEGILLN